MAWEPHFKKEVKAYYETHMDEPKEVASRFGVPVRTIRAWIKDDGWQMGYYITGKTLGNVKKEIAKNEVAKAMDVVKSEVVKEVTRELEAQRREGELDYLLDDEYIGNVSANIIFDAMSEGYMDEEMIKTMLIARNIFHTNVSLNAKNPANMNLASQYMAMVMNAKKSIHGTEPTNIININNVGTIHQEKMATMSDEELEKFIEMEQKRLKE